MIMKTKIKQLKRPRILIAKKNMDLIMVWLNVIDHGHMDHLDEEIQERIGNMIDETCETLNTLALKIANGLHGS